MGHPSANAKGDVLIDETKFSRSNSEYSTALWKTSNDKGWKPLTFSSLVLVPLVFFTGALVIILGLLQWQNFRQGALFLTSSVEGFSTMQSFLYRYLPTIIVVTYGMAWSWIDLDVKRLEPWFQLAQERGVEAKKSLLLHYPADFLPFVPFKAAKLRQWEVLCASSIMVFVVWAVTPLQNGIFQNNVLSLSSGSQVYTTNITAEISTQIDSVGGSILNSAYSVLWLGQTIPAFTTTEYAIAPFQATELGPFPESNQTLTSRTSLYYAQLDCRAPANISVGQGSVSFDNGNGCNAEDMISFPDSEDSQRFSTYFFGYQDAANVDNSLQLGGCPKASSDLFLAIWKLAGSGPPDFRNSSNATALFCEPSYYEQEVDATVTLPDHAIIAMKEVSQKRPLSPTRFNTTQFESLVAAGVTSETMRQDISETTPLHQDSRLVNMSITVPAANMIGFAVGSTHYEPDAYLNPDNLESALDKAYKLLFALAMQSTMPPLDKELVAGTRSSTLQAVSLVPVFAILSQVALFLILIGACYLMYALAVRPSQLEHDPDTLAKVMALSNDPQIGQIFRPCDLFDEKKLEWELSSLRFRLNSTSPSEAPQIQVDQVANSKHQQRQTKPRRISNSSAERQWTQPVEFKAIVGCPLLLALGFVAASLVYLHEKSYKENGLALPSKNPVVQRIVINLIPTTIATILEPFWVLLNRLVCLMRPMEELHRGDVTAGKSLLLNYTSLPPQLVVWRAVRARHYFLALLSCTALLANLLTIALSGVFNINRVFHTQTSSLKQLYEPQFGPHIVSSFETAILGNYNQYDAFHVAVANFSNETSLPIWTAPYQFFLPLQPNRTVSDDGGQSYSLHTAGYGAELGCQQLTETSSPARMELAFNTDATLVNFITTHVQEDGSMIRCKPCFGNLDSNFFAAIQSENATWMKIYGDPVGHKALEIANLMLAANTNPTAAQASFCAKLIVKGWIRADLSPRTSNQTTASNPSISINSTFMSCQPKLKTAMFDITVALTGMITSSQQYGPTSYNLPANSNLSLAVNFLTQQFGGISNPYWHNDTIASDWANDLTKKYTGSTAFLNSTLPPPTYSSAVSITNDIYARLFAIQLSLQSSQLTPAASSAPLVPAILSTLEFRIFLSEPLYRIALAVLILNFLVALVFYPLVVQKPFLPRLPTSIASQIAYFAGSRAMDDVLREGSDLRELDRKGFRYSYGRFVGKDGWSHVGVDRSPFVTRVDADDRPDDGNYDVKRI